MRFTSVASMCRSGFADPGTGGKTNPGSAG